MQADYVVVGAGSAGCVVAARLSETGASVILLEAGPTDWYPMIHIPAGMRSLLRNPLVNWNYTTEPEKGSGERRLDWPRGRTLGGTSSINGMLYVRGAPAGRLTFEGKRCTGVEFIRGGNTTTVRANREVIVSGGTVNSPHILQISGIGPAAHLQQLGIPVVHDLPGVGANLIDHYVIRLVHRVQGTRTANELARFPGYLPEIPKFFLRGNGALTFGVTTAQLFCDSREGLASPDLQLLFTPGSTNTLKFGQLDHNPAMSCVVCVVKPDSRGTVMATSADPLGRPAIKPNYLTTHTDELALLGGTKHVRKIFAQPALAQHSLGETSRGPGI